jgi:hypothetical protein
MANVKHDELLEFKTLVDRSTVLLYTVMDKSLVGQDLPISLMSELITPEQIAAAIKAEWHELLRAYDSFSMVSSLLDVASRACSYNEFSYLIADLGIYYKTELRDTDTHAILQQEKITVEAQLDANFMGRPYTLNTELTASLANLIVVTRHKEAVFEAVEQVKQSQHVYDAYERLGEPLIALNNLLEKMIHS